MATDLLTCAARVILQPGRDVSVYIPFLSKQLTLKQVPFEKLERIEKFNLQFFFPGKQQKSISPAAGVPEVWY